MSPMSRSKADEEMSRIAERAKLCPLIVKTVSLNDLSLLKTSIRLREYCLERGYEKLQVSVAEADGRQTPAAMRSVLLQRAQSSASMASVETFAGESKASICEDDALGAVVGLATLSNTR